MNTRAFTLAIIIAAMAMFMVWTYVSDEEKKMIAKYGVETPVVVAKVDIQELELIDDQKVVVKNVPQSFVAPGHFKSIKEIENMVATVPILKGEQLTKPRITPPGMKTGLSRQVSVGKRAVALQVSEKQAVGRLLKPGDRVDVIAAIDFTNGSRKDKQKVKTILQDVLILSTGMSMTNTLPLIGVTGPDGDTIKKMNLSTYSTYNSVTLELEPYDAQRLLFLIAYANAQPYLVLRNNGDNKNIRIQSTRLFDVLGDDAAEAKSYFSDKYKEGQQ